MSVYEYHLVYKTTNLLNNRYYIGIHSTNNLEDGYLGSGNAIKLAVDKYGIENFDREILHYCDDRDMALSIEKKLVTEDLVNDPDCYNLRTGGENGFRYNDDWVKMVSDRAKKTWTGRKHTEATKEKMRRKVKERIAKGDYIPEEVRKKISETVLKQSDEISERVSKDWADPEHKKWRSQQMRGVKKKIQYCPHCGKGMRANLSRHIKSKHFELME